MLRGSIIRTRMKKSLCAFLNLYRMVRREWNPHSEDGHTVMMCWGCSRGLLYIYELFNFFFYTKPLPLTISYKQYAENKKLSMMFSSHTKKNPCEDTIHLCSRLLRLRYVEGGLCRGAKRQNERILQK